MLISSWMLLWLEQRVKVPERTLDKVICGHLCEPTGQTLHLNKKIKNKI